MQSCEPDAAVEGRRPAIEPTFRLMLEHLCGALRGISESLRHVPGVPAFPWVILAGTVVVVSLTVKR